MRRGELEIGRLTLRGGLRDVPAVRAAAVRLVAPLAAPPPGLPPSSILVIRRLSRRAPPSLVAGPEWAREGQAMIADWARRASRPLRGPVSPDAGAVLFLDEAELLACWARDRLRGVAAQRWYWRTLLGRGALEGGSRALGARLSEHAAWVPAVLALLAPTGDDVAVVEALEVSDALRVWAAMVATRVPEGASIAARAHEVVDEVATAPTRGEAARPEVVTLPPWHGWSAAPAHLEPARAMLLGWARVIERAPRTAASARFQARARAWWRMARGRGEAVAVAPPGTIAAPPDHVAPALDPPSPPRAARQPALPDRARAPSAEPHAPARAAADMPAPCGEGRRSVDRSAAERPVDPTPSIAVVPRAAEALVDRARSAGHPQPEDPKGAETSKDAPRALPQGAAPFPSPSTAPADPEAWSEAGIVSALGGLFHLVHVIDRLTPDPTLDAWDRLELMTLALLGPGERSPDPLWAALAHLAGRDPHGPLESTPTIDAAVAEAHASFARLLVDVSWREIIARPARVYVSRTHVDVVQRLVDVSLPLRLAGLDRDPGWRPSYRRVLAFHFL